MATISLRNINTARFDYNVYMMSSVGIGTASPAYQVDIENSSNAVLRLHAGTNASASVRLKNDAQDWDVNCQVTDKFAIYNQTAGVQAFTIDTSNNVGIGTTAPTYKLHVKDNNSAVAMGEYAAGAVIWMDGANGDLAGGDYFGIHARDAGAALDFSYASTNRLSILAGGNVGIGTTSPAVKLDVVGGISLQSNNNLTWGNATYAAGVPTIVGVTGSGFYFHPDGSTSGVTLRILADGKVGIGTAAPSQILHVQGSGGTSAFIRVTAPSYGSANFGMSDTGLRIQTNATVDSSDDADIYFHTDGGGEVMRIK